VSWNVLWCILGCRCSPPLCSSISGFVSQVRGVEGMGRVGLVLTEDRVKLPGCGKAGKAKVC
jgi:hypothetical protein